MLTFVIPELAAFLLKFPKNGLLFDIIVRFLTPIAFFVLFLYVWYKLIELYYRKKAREYVEIERGD